MGGPAHPSTHRLWALAGRYETAGTRHCCADIPVAPHRPGRLPSTTLDVCVARVWSNDVAGRTHLGLRRTCSPRYYQQRHRGAYATGEIEARGCAALPPLV